MFILAYDIGNHYHYLACVDNDRLLCSSVFSMDWRLRPSSVEGILIKSANISSINYSNQQSVEIYFVPELLIVVAQYYTRVNIP